VSDAQPAGPTRPHVNQQRKNERNKEGKKEIKK